MSSIIQAKESLIKMFFRDTVGEEDLSPEDMAKRIKKIEFSQSIKRGNLQKSLPFTHTKLDQIALEPSLQGSDFDIAQAKQLLKQVVSKKSARPYYQDYDDEPQPALMESVGC